MFDLEGGGHRASGIEPAHTDQPNGLASPLIVNEILSNSFRFRSMA